VAAQLLTDPDTSVRRQALWALMALSPQRWSGPVLQRVLDDPDCDVASAAFFALRKAGSLTKADVLCILTQSSQSEVRSLAADAATWSGEDLDLLIRLLSDRDAAIRLCATKGLRQIKSHRAVSHAIDLLGKEQDPQVISSLLHLFGEVPDKSAVPALLKWAQSGDDFERLDAISALAKIGDDRAIPIAKAMLKENRRPERPDANQVTGQSHSQLFAPEAKNLKTIREQVKDDLLHSPSLGLKALAFLSR